MGFYANSYSRGYDIKEEQNKIQIENCFCRGWLIEERVDEFLIEKYIEISIDTSISTGIVYADPHPHSFSVTIQ